MCRYSSDAENIVVVVQHSSCHYLTTAVTLRTRVHTHTLTHTHIHTVMYTTNSAALVLVAKPLLSTSSPSLQEALSTVFYVTTSR